LCDLSRLFPPVQPVRKLDQLFKLFRPEFVQDYEAPLCSDGFTSFVHNPALKQVNDRIIAATNHLMHGIIPSFAKGDFTRVVRALHTIGLLPRDIDFHIPWLLHQAGINLRYLGNICNHVEDPLPGVYLLIEIFARCIKRLCNQRFLSVSETHTYQYQLPFIEATTAIMHSFVTKSGSCIYLTRFHT